MKIRSVVAPSILFAAMPRMALALENNGFQYIINGNSTVTVSGYTGQGGDLTVPSILSGLPVRSIWAGAFANKVNITSVIVPEGITYVAEQAFASCSGLVWVRLPASVTSISNNTFSNCQNLMRVELSQNSVLASIGANAFFNCQRLVSLPFPPSNPTLTTIGPSAFSYCVSLQGTLVVPGHGTVVGKYAFKGCSGIEKVLMPAGVLEIQQGVFSGCTGIKSVEIHNGISVIPNYAFHGCSALESVALPLSVAAIGSNAFTNCDGLSRIYIPNGVISIGSHAFSECNLLEFVSLGKKVDSVGPSAFASCANLMTVLFKGDAPDFFDSTVFFNSPMDTTIFHYSSSAGFTSPMWRGRPTMAIDPPTGFKSWEILDCLPSERRSPIELNGPVGIPNLLAYAMALNPLEMGNEDMPAVASVNPLVGILRYRYSRAKGLTGVSLTALVSNNLKDWTPANVLKTEVVMDLGQAEIVELELSTNGERNFFVKLQAEQSE